MSNDASSVLSVARREIGYSRWNDPQAGTKYGRWFAQKIGEPYYGESGVPYCAMFVSWVFDQAGATCAGLPGAYCPTMLSAASSRVVAIRSAQPGDIVYFDWGNDRVPDHVGIVEQNNGSYITTIEGNTSGGIVARRTRSWGVVRAIVRPSYGGATSAGWINRNGRWWYRHADGSYTTNGWEQIDGKWYHFDSEGWMQTGWVLDNGNWYWLTESGAMATGWVSVNGKWYYLTESGAMATGWELRDGTWYYLDPEDGEMKTGWVLDNGNWYWLQSDGSMAKDQVVEIGGKFYALDENGAMMEGDLDIVTDKNGALKVVKNQKIEADQTTE